MGEAHEDSVRAATAERLLAIVRQANLRRAPPTPADFDRFRRHVEKERRRSLGRKAGGQPLAGDPSSLGIGPLVGGEEGRLIPKDALDRGDLLDLQRFGHDLVRPRRLHASRIADRGTGGGPFGSDRP